MERTESKFVSVIEETSKQNRRIEDCITDIRILEEKEKVSLGHIDWLREEYADLLRMIEEQEEYTDKLTRLLIDYNGRQTERIFNIYKMLVIVAIALWILFIVVILK